MRTLIVAALLSVATSVSPRLWADDEAKNKGIGGGLAERIQDLNLTADQEDKIADITNRRNQIAGRMIDLLEGAAFEGKEINEDEAGSLIHQAQELLEEID